MAKHDYCEKCPYKLGILKSFVDPCPHCKKDGYSFVKRTGKKTTRPGKKRAAK